MNSEQENIYYAKNGIGYKEVCAIKYLSRWRGNNDIGDLYRVGELIDKLIEEAKADGY